MPGIAGDTAKELEFMYESDAVSSFLVIRCAGRIIEYQAGMVDNNEIDHVIPVETVRKEDANYFYYNITSQVPLSVYLKRNKLSREAFLRLILNIAACMNNAAGYLLYPSNFLLKQEFIYVDPATQDVMVVYIPAEFRHDDAGSLQALVSELLMQHIDEEDFCSGNLVQRILAEVKNETFSIRGLMTLANELLYAPGSGETSGSSHEPEICAKTLVENREKYKIEEKKEARGKTGKKMSSPALVIAVLLQFVMGAVIYMCRGVIAGTGKDAAVNYAAVALIVLAVEVLIFRKLQSLKLFSIRTVGNAGPDVYGGPDALHDAGRPQMPGMLEHEKGRMQAVTEEDGDAARQRQTAPGFSQKTENLETRDTGGFVLINVNRQPGEKDIVIDRDEFIVGRLAGYVDHALHSNAVGKLHAVFVRRNGCCYVRDLNSLNGTYINGKRIESNKEILLRNNDTLRLANCEFIFSCAPGHKTDKPEKDKEAGTCMEEGLYGMTSRLAGQL